MIAQPVAMIGRETGPAIDAPRRPGARAAVACLAFAALVTLAPLAIYVALTH